MRHSKFTPDVNAGSMADIAFLLLIFFLVTAVIPNNHGITRKLAKTCPPNQDCHININDRNILRIIINNNDDIMVDNDIITIEDLKAITKTFLDNNGDGSCSYCNGLKSSTLSDNPSAAVISLQTNKQTSYNQFIQVQDELTKAYYELRELYSINILNKSVELLSKEELKTVQEAYPFILSEAQTK